MDFELARKNMVASQVLTNKVNDTYVLEAFEKVPREAFLPLNIQYQAYIDVDLQLSPGRWLMQPMVAARLVQLANLTESDSVLVVPCGVGYLSTIISHIVESVVAIEQDEKTFNLASKITSKLNADNVVVINSPIKEGCFSEAPFDAIFFDGGIDEIPNSIQNQLSDGGRLIAVVNDGKVGRATIVHRYGDAFGKRVEFDVSIPTIPEFKSEKKFLF